MQIIHHMTIDMAKPLPAVPVSAVQGDGNTRVLRLTLRENGESWAVPQGVSAAVAFHKADGHKGLYDTLPDGTKAVTMESNAVSAVLAPQALSCPGEVSACVVFHDSKGNQLAAFPFYIKVAPNPAAGQEISNDYYRYSTMEAVSEAVDAALASLETAKQDFLTKAEEALSVVHDTATADAPAIACESAGESIRVSDSSDRPLKGLTLYGKTTQSGTPTPENPVPLESVGAGGAIHTTVAGKNLLPFDHYKNASITANGVTATVNDDGSITWTGTATDYVAVELYKGTVSVFPQKFTVLNLGTFSNVGIDINIMDGATTLYNSIIQALQTFDMEDYPSAKTIIITAKRLANEAVSGTVYPMLVAGTVTTAEYEPGKEQQTLTVSTPKGLDGIPVESGGNYTDENGQQWVCDEIDFARGVYVRRTTELTITEANQTDSSGKMYGISNYELMQDTTSGNQIRCDQYSHASLQAARNADYAITMYGYTIWVRNKDCATLEAFNAALAEKPITVIAPLRIATETALSAEELAAYAALHSNKPNITAFNDAGAGMKLNYVADTKTYIDQKLAAISKAILS